MIPLIPILAWTGGIAAGAQVARGVVRGAGELVRGRPGAALLEVADGCVAPLRSACEQVSELGHDVFKAVFGPEPVVIVQVPRSRPRQQQAAQVVAELLNGVP